MRIISGTHKGRNITPPKNLPVRPTTDFAKESLFNILNNQVDFEELKVLDLFSGTGGIAFEFASRGSKDVTAVEKNGKCADFIRSTARALSLPVKVLKMDAMSFLKNPVSGYDLIFADPFYEFEDMNKIPDLVFSTNVLNPEGLLIVEHSVKTAFNGHVFFREKRTYGNVNFSFFKRTIQDQ